MSTSQLEGSSEEQQRLRLAQINSAIEEYKLNLVNSICGEKSGCCSSSASSSCSSSQNSNSGSGGGGDCMSAAAAQLIVSRHGTVRGSLNHVKTSLKQIFKEPHITKPVANPQLNITPSNNYCNYNCATINTKVNEKLVSHYYLAVRNFY